MNQIKDIFLLIFLFGIFLPVIFAQTTAVERQRERQAVENLEQRRAKMRELESKPRPMINQQKVTRENREIYKESEEWITFMRQVGEDDLRVYSGFLKDKKNGIFRLFPNFDCVSKNVVRVDGPCRDFVPSNSDYSFRKRDFTADLFHEIELNNGYLLSNGFFSQGIMVELGDIPIDTIARNYAGLTFLNSFQPAKTALDARAMAYQLTQGISSNGFFYSNKLVARSETTYGLRVIAYRGDNAARNAQAAMKLYGPNVYRGLATTQRNFYDASADDRKDILVVFRVVRSSADGGLTIIWRELRKVTAPDLKFGKGEIPEDFKPK